MSRRQRIVRRLAAFAGTAALILLLAGFVCLDDVDYRPYFRENYYTQTVAQLRTSALTNTPVRGELFAGFGSAVLTPTVKSAQEEAVAGKFRELPLAGYGARNGKPATGTHDDLHVKAVALRIANRTVVMVGVDALIIPREISDAACERLKRELGLSREQIYLSATHTHCSLGGWGEGIVAHQFAGEFNAGSRIWFVEQLVAAIRDAVADLKPAMFGKNSFAAPEFVRNRVVGELGKVDSQFSFLVVKQNGGRTAILGSYSAHATILSARVMEFSSDYPGFWQRKIESATGGMAVFLAGGVGSHAPNPGKNKNAFEGAEKMGNALAERLLEKIPQTPMTNFVSLATLSVDVSMPQLNVRVTDGVRLRPWLAAKFLPAMTNSFLQAVRIENSIWISTPCDFSGELALRIKDFIRPHGCDAVITSFNGDYVGYVIPSRYYHLDGYEPRTMSFFGPHVPDYFDELIREMALDLAKE